MLLQWIGSIGSLAAVAVVEAVLAAFYLRGWSGRRAGAVALLAILAGQGLAFAAAPYCRVESRYHCLDTVDTSAWAGFPSRGMFLDGWVQSIEPSDGSGRLAIDAHAFLDAWAHRRRAAGAEWAAFFIGCGGYSLPMRWVEAWPGFRATVAEIDPAVTAFAATIGFRRDHHRIVIRDDDARAVLRRDSGRYDLVFSDAYAGHTMPAHLVTVEFHRLVRERLAAGGVYAINAYDWKTRPRFLEALVHSLRQVFPEVVVWTTSAVPNRSGNRAPFQVLASVDPIDRAALADRWGGREWTASEPAFDAATTVLLTDDYAPVDRLTLR